MLSFWILLSVFDYSDEMSPKRKSFTEGQKLGFIAPVSIILSLPYYVRKEFLLGSELKLYLTHGKIQSPCFPLHHNFFNFLFFREGIEIGRLLIVSGSKFQQAFKY